MSSLIQFQLLIFFSCFLASHDEPCSSNYAKGVTSPYSLSELMEYFSTISVIFCIYKFDRLQNLFIKCISLHSNICFTLNFLWENHTHYEDHIKKQNFNFNALKTLKFITLFSFTFFKDFKINPLKKINKLKSWR